MNPLTGTRLRERRITLGLRQGHVAAKAGISASYLNLIEYNRRAVAGDVLARLAGVLDLDPAALSGAAETALADDLRGAAAAHGQDGAEAEAFIARFPDWAAVLAAQGARMAGLERAVAALNDRLNHDPHLSAALHEVLSAAASVRATAGILAETEDIDPDWRARFHRNLDVDSARLSLGAEALVAYLDAAGQADQGAVTPQDEVEGWLAARGWSLDEAEAGRVDVAGIAGLASEAARALAQQVAAVAVADAAAMPLAAVRVALDAVGPDPVAIAARFGGDVIAACRRISGLTGAGLVICDGAGALVYRRPLPGFSLPRAGAACALWPLYAALGRAMWPMEAVAEMVGQPPQRFLLRAYCQTRVVGGFGGVELRNAAMLILPAPAGVAPTLAIGPTCRICPREGCMARREPSILTG
jgi:transcriptional regulator with XRE-family HTH domain